MDSIGIRCVTEDTYVLAAVLSIKVLGHPGRSFADWAGWNTAAFR